MRFLFYACAVVFGVSISGSLSLGAEASRPQRAKEAKAYTVRISSQTANIFEPSPSGGHGSGLIYSLNEDEGIVFTNRHVVEASHLDARIVVLQFNGGEGIPEEVVGEVVHESNLYDFAVIKFNLKSLRRARKFIAPAKFPNFQEFLTLSEEGRMMMAIGSPLDSLNHVTFGSITSKSYGTDWGISKDPFFGPNDFIRIEAAINGGNSGGPLVDLDTGKIVSINSAKIASVGVDNYGFSIPIAPLIEEWARVKNNAQNFSQRTLGLAFAELDKHLLDLDGASQLIERAIPNFFNYYTGALLALSKGGPSGKNLFETGDIVLTVNGETVGNNEQKLIWLLDRAKSGNVEFKVLRRTKEVSISFPMQDLRKAIEDRLNEFVMVGGIFFQNLLDLTGQSEAGHGVRVLQILENSIGQQVTNLKVGSVVTHIEVGEQKIAVNSTTDLSRALKSVPENSVVKVIGRNPVRNEQGQAIMTQSGYLMSPTEMFFFLPVGEVVTPAELSLKEVREGYDFTLRNRRSLDWRNYIRKPTVATADTCSGGMAELALGRSSIGGISGGGGKM